MTEFRREFDIRHGPRPRTFGILIGILHVSAGIIIDFIQPIEPDGTCFSEARYG